eukprot:7728773-Ditylum_brightwellii.AAC.1
MNKITPMELLRMRVVNVNPLSCSPVQDRSQAACNILLGSTCWCVAHMQWTTAAPRSTTAPHAMLSTT